MAFDGNEGQMISLTEASAMTAEYRSQHPGEVKAHIFGKNLINSILNQTDCVGIRMYHGIDTSGARHLVLVGVKADESDMTSGKIADRPLECPPNCDDQSSLNG